MKNKGFYKNENKERVEKVKAFFKESGFYIMVVAGLCILAVGAVYFTTNHLISSPDELEGELIHDNALSTESEEREIVIVNDETQPDDYNTEPGGDEALNNDNNNQTPFNYLLEGDPQTDLDDHMIAEHTDDLTESGEPDIETVKKPTAAPTIAPKPTDAPEKPEEENKDSQEVIKLFGKTPEFIMPVKGEIILDYAVDRLLYSKTLDEWRIHTGIDIAASRGDAVKAAGDGYIKEIKKDPCYGITITIDHENGYKTIYSNLASESMVSVNQKVKAGDAISSVGNTAIFECMDPPHLHFEVYKDDKLINPGTVLSVEQK